MSDEMSLVEWQRRMDNARSESEIQDLLRRKPKAAGVHAGEANLGAIHPGLASEGESGEGLPLLDKLRGPGR